MVSRVKVALFAIPILMAGLLVRSVMLNNSRRRRKPCNSRVSQV